MTFKDLLSLASRSEPELPEVFMEQAPPDMMEMGIGPQMGASAPVDSSMMRLLQDWTRRGIQLTPEEQANVAAKIEGGGYGSIQDIRPLAYRSGIDMGLLPPEPGVDDNSLQALLRASMAGRR